MFLKMRWSFQSTVNVFAHKNDSSSLSIQELTNADVQTAVSKKEVLEL